MKKTQNDRVSLDAQSNEIFFREERDGRRSLAFRVTGIPSRSSGARINSMLAETGTLARPAKGGSPGKGKPPSLELVDWKIERRDLSEGEWVFMGPDVPGVSLRSLLSAVRSEESAATFLSALARVARALEAVEASGRKIPSFYASSVIVGDSGEILLLPGSLIRGGDRKPAQALTGFARIDADARKTPSHFLGAAVREAAVLSDGGRRDPRADALPLSRIAPRLDPTLLSADESWRKDRGGIGLARWAAALEAAGPGFFRRGAVTRNEAARKERALSRAGRLGGLKSFVSRRRGYLIAAGAVTVAAAVVASSILDDRKQALRFFDYAPEKVVSTFYASYSALNDDDMSACVKKGSLKADIQAVINLSLVLKMRLATERRNTFIGAQAWLDAGKPPIAPNDYIFGVTDLVFAPLGESAARPGGEEAPRSFKASYTLWYTDPREDIAPGADMNANIMEYSSRKVIDVLSLEKTPLGWKVASLERDEREPVFEDVVFTKQGTP